MKKEIIEIVVSDAVSVPFAQCSDQTTMTIHAGPKFVEPFIEKPQKRRYNKKKQYGKYKK